MPDENVVEPVTIIEKVTPIAPEAKPSKEELAKSGWSSDEITKAEALGVIPKEEPAKSPEPAPTPTPEPSKVEEHRKPISSLPEFNMTPEQEKVFLETFGKGAEPRAMYFRMKNERRARQEAEAKAKELEARLAKLEAAKEAPPLPVDDDGNPIDPEDKPLTLKQLKEIQRQEQERIAREQAANRERVVKVATAQQEQEEYARAVYPDFDDTVTKAKDVMQKLDSLVPEKHRQLRVIKLIRELQIAAANADRIAIDEDHAAMIAYEIGRYHPEYGIKSTEPQADDGTPKTDPSHGRLTPEQMKRVAENTQRRTPSAAITAGGGKRIVSASDVTVKELNEMSAKERLDFRTKYPARYDKLLRG